LTNQRAVRRSRGYLVGLWILAVVLFTEVASRSQQQAQPNVTVKKVAAQPTTTVQGNLLYKDHCAACHGMTGKGDGPAAAALKTPPADLTVLAKNNKGKFPDLKIVHILESGSDLKAHGSKDMPIWGPIFLSMGPAGAGGQIGHLREANLTAYLKSIQQK